MAEFDVKKIDPNEINGGKKYKNGDGVQAETLNSVISASLFAQETAKIATKDVQKNSNKISALENALISAGTIDKRSSIMTEEKQQTGGTDLEGLTILDGSLCTVNTIRGNTVATDTGIKHAQISGIKSSGRNLLTLDYMVATDDGNTWTNALVKNPDGTFTISKNGTNRMSKQWECDIPAGTYTLSWEISDYKNATGIETTGSPTIRFLDENKTEIKTGRLYLTSWKKSQRTISKDVKYIDIYMSSDSLDGDYVTIKNIMMYKGTENPLLPYMPYGVESTLQFPETIELGKWDYIVNGNIIRKTTTLQLNGTEDMWSMNGGQYVEIYPNMSQFTPPSSGNFYADIVVNNGYTVTDSVGNATGKAVNLDTWGILSIRDPDYMSVNDDDPEESVRRFKQHLQDLAMNETPFTIYIEAVTSTVEPIAFNNQYVVWNKGFEQVLTPEDENGLTCFDYGANTTEENEYMILLGGTN